MIILNKRAFLSSGCWREKTILLRTVNDVNMKIDYSKIWFIQDNL